jgi:type IV pilus assembly protein PilA
MKRLSRPRVCAAIVLALAIFSGSPVFAQNSDDANPSSALSSALAAACRANAAQFSNYLTAENAAAFRALPEEQRTALLKRFSFLDAAGKPLISSDQQNHTVLRCEASEATTEFRFGEARIHENLAFIPVTVVDGEKSEFGLVRENGGWRLLSLGLVLLDIPQLSQQWTQSTLAQSEEGAISALQDLQQAIQSYHRAWGSLPESLAELGPAPQGQISPQQAALVDAKLASGSASGYQFRYRVVPAQDDQTAFEIVAMPETYGKTGQRSFFLDSSGKIHAADKHGQMAAPSDPVIPLPASDSADRNQ